MTSTQGEGLEGPIVGSCAPSVQMLKLQYVLQFAVTEEQNRTVSDLSAPSWCQKHMELQTSQRLMKMSKKILERCSLVRIPGIGQPGTRPGYSCDERVR